MGKAFDLDDVFGADYVDYSATFSDVDESKSVHTAPLGSLFNAKGAPPLDGEFMNILETSLIF